MDVIILNLPYLLTNFKNHTLAPVSFSNALRVLPLGPMMRPMKLMSGWLSWGIITLSDTLIVGALKQKELLIDSFPRKGI